ncbi:hypothetical protein Tco_0216878 [Tanacetum coccineum]
MGLKKKNLLSNNFNDWFWWPYDLSLELDSLKKMHVIEQPYFPALEAVAELTLLLSSDKTIWSGEFDLIQSSMLQTKVVYVLTNVRVRVGDGEAESAGTVVGLAYMADSRREGLPKKAETPQVMMIKSGKIQKANKKSLNAKGKNKVNGKGKDKKVYIPKPNNPKSTAKERPAKDDACHHFGKGKHLFLNLKSYRDRSKRFKETLSTYLHGVHHVCVNALDLMLRFAAQYDKPFSKPNPELRVECYCDSDLRLIEMTLKSQTKISFRFEWRRSDWKELQAKLQFIDANEPEFRKAPTLQRRYH